MYVKSVDIRTPDLIIIEATKMKQRKQHRRLEYLLTKYWPMEYDRFLEISKDGWPSASGYEEIFDLAKNLHIKMNDLYRRWRIIHAFRAKDKMDNKYGRMPKSPRQDNKTYINKGNGHPQRGWLRYPKKKRKTAWKRFYKLFPHLKPDENEKTNTI